jgi:hypothetical protein
MGGSYPYRFTSAEVNLFGMNHDTKMAIEHIFIMDTKTAQSIKYALRDTVVLDKLPSTIIKDNVIEYDQKQIENYIFQTLKPKILIKSSFNYGELYLWVTEHSSAPDNMNELYEKEWQSVVILKIHLIW